VIIDLLRDETKRKDLAIAGKKHAQLFDWDVVAQQIFSIYEMAIVGGNGVTLGSDHRSWNRFLTRDEEKR
jgi:phosphatidylinositol alpha-mannosyltransferase